jgi:hypothetical protein
MGLLRTLPGCRLRFWMLFRPQAEGGTEKPSLKNGRSQPGSLENHMDNPIHAFEHLEYHHGSCSPAHFAATMFGHILGPEFSPQVSRECEDAQQLLQTRHRIALTSDTGGSTATLNDRRGCGRYLTDCKRVSEPTRESEICKRRRPIRTRVNLTHVADPPTGDKISVIVCMLRRQTVVDFLRGTTAQLKEQ